MNNSEAVMITEKLVYSGLGNRVLEVLKESLRLLEASKNPKDIGTLLDIYRLINAQPTEITEVQSREITSENLSSLTDEELELLHKLPLN